MSLLSNLDNGVQGAQGAQFVDFSRVLNRYHPLNLFSNITLAESFLF